jgi:hypothetical protein
LLHSWSCAKPEDAEIPRVEAHYVNNRYHKFIKTVQDAPIRRTRQQDRFAGRAPPAPSCRLIGNIPNAGCLMAGIGARDLSAGAFKASRQTPEIRPSPALILQSRKLARPGVQPGRASFPPSNPMTRLPAGSRRQSPETSSERHQTTSSGWAGANNRRLQHISPHILMSPLQASPGKGAIHWLF